VRRSSARAAITLLIARCVVEGVTFGALLAVVHAVAGGRSAVPLFAAALAMTGASLLVVALVRELASERRSGAVIAATFAAGILAAFVLPARGLDGAGTLARVIAFAILAEAFLWRTLSVARGGVRWSDARNAIPVAGIAIVVAAIAPGPIDRAPLAPLALVVVACGGLSLSLARAAEELSLMREGEAGSVARVSSVTSVAVLFGAVAILAAAVAPSVERLLAEAGERLSPLLEDALFLILLPLGYLAAYFIGLLENLLRGVDFSGFARNLPQRSPEEEEQMLREIERNRPWIAGGFELLIALVVAAVALVLLERMVRERRIALPGGAELERGPTDSVSLGATLASLLPRRSSRRHAPRDDGTPIGALRALYWRLLTLAERVGPGWRDPAETPDEHARRLVLADARWGEAAPIVVAFDELRYGEIAPDAATVGRARAALRALEASLRT
jgi:hypothetical protein